MKPLFKLRKTDKYGRGVYATRNIRKGEVIERSPCIIFTKDEHNQFSDTLMNFYVFGWPNGQAAESALALGVGSLFNHDSKPNVTYLADTKTKQMVFKACSAVKKGQQLLINYGYDPKEVRKRWEIKKLQEKKDDDKADKPKIFGNPEFHPDKLEPKILGLEASLREAESARRENRIKEICRETSEAISKMTHIGPHETCSHFWDPSADGGQGAEVRLSLSPYGVIKNDKFEFWDKDKVPVLPKPPFVDLSMSRADAELTVAFLILVFLVGMFRGLITARGY